MEFQQIINAKLSRENDRPLMQKDAIPISNGLQQYLYHYGRCKPFPLSYTDLLYYSHANALRDKKGKLTHWETAVYDSNIATHLHKLLLATWAILKGNDEPELASSYEVKNIDFCEFGNSIPFRVTLLHKQQLYTEKFYIKLADASRIYGLELDHLLSPDATSFLYHNNTLVETHIEGIPGDVFLREHSQQLSSTQSTLLATAFIRFNECCFARLLGDMRSYNFVVANLSGSNKDAFRIRAIDFDQQSYEGRKNLYLPQFYKENLPFVEHVLTNFSAAAIATQQQQERAAMKQRAVACRYQLMQLLNAMKKDELSENYKILSLRNELNEHFQTTDFSHCKSMGALVKQQLKQVLLHAER